MKNFTVPLMQRNAPKAYILVSNDKNTIQKTSAYTAKTLGSIMKTCLGPRAMQKMLLTKINSIELTNDGNSILREMDVSHPSARCLIELAQTQDDECGDGTTTVLVLAADLLDRMVPLLKQTHPIHVCRQISAAKDICLKQLDEISVSAKEDGLLEIIKAGVATKLCTILKIPIPELAFKAATLINKKDEEGANKRIDIKSDVKVEKIVGSFEESEVIEGIIIEKDLIHSQMRRNIENPKILVIDCPLEYRKGESVTNMELSDKDAFTRALQIEEEHVRKLCMGIVDSGADVVISEKGISDLALSILCEHNITAIRRVKKSDLIRIAKATGTTIKSWIDDELAKNTQLGSAGLFEYVKIGKDYFCRLSKCNVPGAVSVVLRGPTRDILNELDRNFMDAIKIARNVLASPRLVPGGGASEMNLSLKLLESRSEAVFKECAESLKIIPSIISTSSGCGNTLERLHELERQQKAKGPFMGINGITGEITDMREVVMEPLIVKSQTIKSAFECVTQLLRVDGIIESKSK